MKVNPKSPFEQNDSVKDHSIIQEDAIVDSGFYPKSSKSSKYSISDKISQKSISVRSRKSSKVQN
jgi:hypothetical protein